MKCLKMFALGLLSFSLVVACKKEKDDDNSTKGGSNTNTPSVMTRNGEDTKLGYLALYYYGEFYGQGTYNFDISLFSEDLVINPIDSALSGKGDDIYFELISSSSSGVELGTYTYELDNYTHFKISDGSYTVDYDWEEDTAAAYLDFTSGELIMKSNGSTYDFTFTATLEDGSTVSGSYNGGITEFYDGSDTSSTALQQNRFHQQARANLKTK